MKQMQLSEAVKDRKIKSAVFSVKDKAIVIIFHPTGGECTGLELYIAAVDKQQATGPLESCLQTSIVETRREMLEAV